MRVLIYVEPHPIRNSQTIFKDVARHFLPLLAGSTADFDVRMYATRALLGAIGDEGLAGVENRLIRASPAEEALFARHRCDWETEGIPAWLSLMAGGDVAEDYVGVLRRVWSEFPYDIIVHWGENGAVTKFIEERPVTRIAMELGCTRAPFLETVFMDPFGTNGSAIVPRLSVDDLRGIVGDNPMSAAEALYGYSANLEALPYEQQFLPLAGGDWSTRILGATQKIAFLPLQLHDDANLLRFSKYETVEEVVLDVVPKLAAAGYLTVIKTHPSAKHRHNSQAAFSLARAALRPWADDVVWLDATKGVYNNAQLAALADLVVTVNSSVGFESLYYDKVVSVLGDAVYKPAGLFPDLEEAISGSFDLAAYRHGIGLLRRFMFGGYMVSDTVRGDFPAFQSIAVTIDAARRGDDGDAVAIAKRMYQTFSLAREHQARARMVSGGSVPGSSEFGVPVLPAARPHAIESRSAEFSRTEFTGPARRLLALIGAADGDSFRNALRTAFADPETAEKYGRAAGIVDETFYLTTHSDVAKAAMDPVRHWARYGLREGRKPRRGLNIGSVEQLVDELVSAAEPLFAGIPDFLDFPLNPDAEARRQTSLAAIRGGLGTRGHKVAVVAHMYYCDLVPELLVSLANIPEGFDLVVTMPDWGNRQIAESVRAVYPNALLYPVVNRGRDIGPFLDVLPAVLEHDYDAILHLQTKAGYFHAGRLRRDLGELWRGEALDALLGSPERVAAILDAFRTDPAVHEVGPQPHYVSLAKYPYHDRGELGKSLLGATPAEGFFAGTMFWARPNVLRPLVEQGALTLTSFAEETGANDGALAHLVERLFGHAALADGGVIIGAPVDPAEPLVTDLQPLAVTIHEHMEAALAAKLAARKARARGALAW
ncbi:rhamnan synthesis F family protein [Pseudarthrobacter sp. H3Y2-7]|uniref:rhamnan synthesis F family protein n=1 Tax=Pseudarthrobacter naphthalenicus TaxID=3031328 RepID=UPI0023AFD52D|nr:rhamnan synthesis F family protein [Pseudarthrobacter sp. H3Y2-7]MDE8669143.1 rhamnan synthesis F family protein [Pseudarthrobacter sp. H3Y2-7]